MTRTEEELPTNSLNPDYNEIVKVALESEYYSLSKLIINEIESVVSGVDENEVVQFVNEIMRAEKVFIFGVGRVFLMLQSFGKRLGHLGINVQVVGSVTEKAITEKDLLLIASSTGETILPIEIAKKTKNFGARIGIITSARSSTLKSLADFAVHLPCSTKNDPDFGVKSNQGMKSLFEQSLLVFGDTITMMILKKKGLSEDLWKYHANLE